MKIQDKNALFFGGLVLGGYFLYRVTRTKDIPQAAEETIKKVIETPSEIIKKVEKTAKKTIETPAKAVKTSGSAIKKIKVGKESFAKGSKEAKEHMAKLRAKKKPKSNPCPVPSAFSFDKCVKENQDKKDPKAYCAAIQKEIKGKKD